MSCYQRLPLFGSAAIRNCYAQHLGEARERFAFLLVAWVVMPEHVHLLILPKLPEYPVSEVLRSLHRSVAMEVIARWRELRAPVLSRLTDSRGQTHFWQRGGGYDRNISRLGNELDEKADYIHENPVRRGLVSRPTDWAWSSARWYAGVEGNLLPIDRIRPINEEYIPDSAC